MSNALYVGITLALVVAGIIEVMRRNRGERGDDRPSVKPTLSGKWESFSDEELAELGGALTRRIQSRPPRVYEESSLDRVLYEELQREVAYRHAIKNRPKVAAHA